MVVAARRGQGGKAQGEGFLLEHAVYVCMHVCMCSYACVLCCVDGCSEARHGTAWHDRVQSAECRVQTECRMQARRDVPVLQREERERDEGRDRKEGRRSVAREH